MNIKIEPVTESSTIQVLFAHYLRFYGKEVNEELISDYLKRRIELREMISFVATLDSKPVGFVNLYLTFSSLNLCKTLVLNDLYVLENCRRIGVAESLIRHVEQWGQSEGYYSVTLETQKSNVSAQSIYRRIGYEEERDFLVFYKRL